MLISELEDPGSRYVKYPPSLSLIDLINDQTTELLPAFPDFDTEYQTILPWYPYSMTIYHPNMTQVVYPGIITDEITHTFSRGYIIYNITDGKRLAFINNNNWVHHPPIWSEDGSKFIFMGDDEFYLVSYEGTVSKLTHMNSELTKQSSVDDQYSAEFYSWSPDNQQLAFWLIHPGTGERTFAVLDTLSGKIIDYCIQAGYNPYNYQAPPFPIWSPDGKEVLFVGNIRPEGASSNILSPGDGNDVVLLDFEKGIAYKVLENIFPMGWLTSP
jgi:hypothetical protein